MELISYLFSLSIKGILVIGGILLVIGFIGSMMDQQSIEDLEKKTKAKGL